MGRHFWQRKTNLSLWESWHIKRIFSMPLRGTIINIWLHGHAGFFITQLNDKDTLKEALTIISQNLAMIGVVPFLDIVLTADMIKSVDSVLKGEGVSGWVESSDTNNNKPIFYINISDIDAVILADKADTQSINSHYQSSNDEERYLAYIERKALPEFRKEFLKTLAHELTHYWHHQRTKADHIFEQRRKRIDNAIESCVNKIKKQPALQPPLSGIPNKAMQNELILSLKSYFIKTYGIARNYLLLFEYNLCSEGMATFLGNLSDDVPLQERIESTICDSIKYAREAAHLLDNMADSFEKCGSLISHITYFFEKQQDNKAFKCIELSKGFRKILISEGKLLKKYVYGIGPIIPLTLLVYGKIPLEKISRMSPNEFIREYEKVCLDVGKKPVVAVRAGTPAVLNIGDYAIKFNHIRRKFR